MISLRSKISIGLSALAALVTSCKREQAVESNAAQVRGRLPLDLYIPDYESDKSVIICNESISQDIKLSMANAFVESVQKYTPHVFHVVRGPLAIDAKLLLEKIIIARSGDSLVETQLDDEGSILRSLQTSQQEQAISDSNLIAEAGTASGVTLHDTANRTSALLGRDVLLKRFGEKTATIARVQNYSYDVQFYFKNLYWSRVGNNGETIFDEPIISMTTPLHTVTNFEMSSSQTVSLAKAVKFPASIQQILALQGWSGAGETGLYFGTQTELSPDLVRDDKSTHPSQFMTHVVTEALAQLCKDVSSHAGIDDTSVCAFEEPKDAFIPNLQSR